MNKNDTLNNNPALMTVIINIQSMSKIIGYEIPFKKLENKTSEALHALQDELIIKYNTVVDNRQFAADMIYKR